MNAPVNEEAALRIALATRQLQQVKTRDLLDLVITIMGEPITPAKLNKLRARTLRNAGKTLFSSIDDKTFDQAFALLKGRGVQKYIHPKPDISKTPADDERGSIRVACTSNSEENIDGQFSTCVRFLIYRVTTSGCQLIDIREPKQQRGGRTSSRDRADLVSDCALLYTTSIGAAAAAKVINAGVHPVQVDDGTTVAAEIGRLQTVLGKDNPPPWLLKSMKLRSGNAE